MPARMWALLKSAFPVLCPRRCAAAEPACAPASNAAPKRTTDPTAAIDRGRLPNMPPESAHRLPPITVSHSTEVPFPAPFLRLEGAPSSTQEPLSARGGYAPH